MFECGTRSDKFKFFFKYWELIWYKKLLHVLFSMNWYNKRWQHLLHPTNTTCLFVRVYNITRCENNQTNHPRWIWLSMLIFPIHAMIYKLRSPKCTFCTCQTVPTSNVLEFGKKSLYRLLHRWRHMSC